MSLVTLICLILFAGVICFLIRKAPFIDEPYKSGACWLILVCVVLYIAYALLGPLPNIRLPHR